MKLTPNQREALEALEYANHSSKYRLTWCTPLDLGGSNGSHHSASLASLARKGLVQFKQRGVSDPEPGTNGGRLWASRGSKCYRITEAGRALLSQETDRG